MVGTQTSIEGLGFQKSHLFLIKNLFPENLLTSSRLHSFVHLFCCHDLRQLNFIRVFGKANTACWAGQMPSDTWDCFMILKMGKISTVFIFPSKPCPQTVLHVWRRTRSLHHIFCNNQYLVLFVHPVTPLHGCPKLTLASTSNQSF